MSKKHRAIGLTIFLLVNILLGCQQNIPILTPTPKEVSPQFTLTDSHPAGRIKTPSLPTITLMATSGEKETVQGIIATVEPTKIIQAPRTSQPSSLISKISGVLAFTTDQEKMLGIIQPDGNDLKYITDTTFLSSVAWSPDGHWLAFNKIKPIVTSGGSSILLNSNIYIIGVDGQELKQITNFADDKYNVTWAPLEGEITFDLGIMDSRDIVTVTRDGKTYLKITSITGSETHPVWSPDGREIAFIFSKDGFEQFELMIAKRGEGIPKRVLNFPISNQQISWSPDGEYIAFNSNYRTESTLLGGTYDGDEGKNYLPPGQTSCGDIYVVKVNGGDLRRLTDMVGCHKNPAWSPDGQYLAFASSIDVSNDSRFDRIFVIDMNGREIGRIDDKKWNITSLAWSPVPWLQIGQVYQITAAGDNLLLRPAPSLTGGQIAILRARAKVTVLEGPMDAEGYYWRKVRTEDGKEGYVKEVGGWFEMVK